jgi:hypothetical protein
MEENKEMPQNLKDFIENSNWIFAKTYANFAPHWYVVKGYYNGELFTKFAKYIRENGVVRKWRDTFGFYLDYQGYSYWALGNNGHKSEPDDPTTTIINRKVIEEQDKLNEYPREVFFKYQMEEKIEKIEQKPIQRKLF